MVYRSNDNSPICNSRNPHDESGKDQEPKQAPKEHGRVKDPSWNAKGTRHETCHIEGWKWWRGYSEEHPEGAPRVPELT